MESEKSVKSVEANEDFCFDLPENCIAHARSLTTPTVVCSLSAVSPKFYSATKSDGVWERLLPSDYHQIISRALDNSDPHLDTSKPLKDVYLYLSDNPILIDGGRKRFCLEKWCGKKCYTLGVSDLTIIGGDNSEHWQWIPLPESRFDKVAGLISPGIKVKIHGKIGIAMLSAETKYGVFLAYSTKYMSYKFRYQNALGTVCMTGQPGHKATISFGEISCRTPLSTLCFHSPPRDKHPKQSDDRWTEVELGEFFVNGGGDGELEMSLVHCKPCYKRDHVVEGIEIRPI